MIIKKFGNKMGIEHDVSKFVGVYGNVVFKNESNNFAKINFTKCLNFINLST